MRIFSIATVGALSLGLALAGSISASGQAAMPQPHKKVFGYQDAVTGEFHPLTKISPDASVVPISGSIQVTFTITLKTAVPTGGSVGCSTDLALTSTTIATASALTYDETSYVPAKVTGTTATCTVITPYSWAVSPSSTSVLDTLLGTYTVSILPANSTQSIIPVVDNRSSSSIFVNTKTLPATGAITKYTVNVTL